MTQLRAKRRHPPFAIHWTQRRSSDESHEGEAFYAHYRRPRYRKDPQDPEGRRDRTYAYYSIAAAEAAGLGDFSKLPAALKVVLENMLRFEDGKTGVGRRHQKGVLDLGRAGRQETPARSPIAPARVLMQDFTGVPAVVDLAAMRDGIKALGGDAQKINPLQPRGPRHRPLR